MTPAHTSPESEAPASPALPDTPRRVLVTVSEVLCVLGTLVGVGVFGTRVEESSGGRLAADATLIAPATPAFSLWSIIYAGLAAYTIWQWLPRNRTSARHRATGVLAAASMLLNAAWLLVTQRGWLAVSVLVMLALLVTLATLVRRLGEHPAVGLGERVLVDGTFGLYLGWVCVATCANIAATLVAWGAPATGALATTLTVVVLGAVVGVAGYLVRRLGARLALAAGIVWGLTWVSVGRAGDAPHNTVVAVAAAVAALAVAALFVLGRRGGVPMLGYAARSRPS